MRPKIYCVELGSFRFLASLVRRLLPAQEQSQESQNMMVSLAADFGISLKRRDAVDVCLAEAGYRIPIQFSIEVLQGVP